MAEGMEGQLGEIIVEKPSWRRWPIVFLFSLYGCHYSFQVSFARVNYAYVTCVTYTLSHNLCNT